MKKSEIMQIIREEVEVILTNEEAVEMFDLDPAELLDEMMNEKTLTSKERKDMSSSSFIFPDGKHFPIPDEEHGRNAWSRAGEFKEEGKPPKWYDGSLMDFMAKVKSAVTNKFPGIEFEDDDKKPGKG